VAQPSREREQAGGIQEKDKARTKRIHLRRMSIVTDKLRERS
jgi:hypothetical protein